MAKQYYVEFSHDELRLIQEVMNNQRAETQHYLNMFGDAMAPQNRKRHERDLERIEETLVSIFYAIESLANDMLAEKHHG